MSPSQTALCFAGCGWVSARRGLLRGPSQPGSAACVCRSAPDGLYPGGPPPGCPSPQFPAPRPGIQVLNASMSRRGPISPEPLRGKATGSETHGAQPRKPPRESVSSCGPRTLRIQGLPSRLTAVRFKGPEARSRTQPVDAAGQRHCEWRLPAPPPRPAASARAVLLPRVGVSDTIACAWSERPARALKVLPPKCIL